MKGEQYKEVVFLEISDLMWWSIGKGFMIPVMFPGVAVYFDGRVGFESSDLHSSADRLVLRQVSDTGFEVVR